MTAPVLAREGARVGGVSTTTAAFVCRTNSDGAGISVEVSRYPDFRVLAGTVTDGTLNAGNNYQATAYVSGLTAGTRYHWRIKADDGAAGVTYGTAPLHANTFTTLPASADKTWRVGFSGCYNGSPTTGGSANATRAKQAAYICQNIVAQDLLAMIHLGDVYYADISTTTAGYADYADNAWYNQTTGVDDGTVGHFRTNFITTMDGPIQEGAWYSMGHVMAEVPGLFMWDDHDRAFNDCDDLDFSEVAAGVGEVNKRDNGHQASHECFMDLNAPFVDQETGRDFATDAASDSVTPQEWYYVDIPPVRFIVLDGRSFRDRNNATDTASKTMLGADQLQWLLDRIDDNPQPLCAVCSPLALDGDHGYFADDDDCWKGFSYERDAILDHIWARGRAHNTVFLTADTHNGHVAEYRGQDNSKPPIYEFMASNGLWLPSAHGYTTGWTAAPIRSADTAGASGNGGRPLLVRTDNNNMLVIEGSPAGMRVKMIETYQGKSYTGPQQARVVHQREYRI